MSVDDSIEEREWAVMQEYIREMAAREEAIRRELAVREYLREEERKRRERRKDPRDAPSPPSLRWLRRFLSWLLGGEI